MSTFGIVQINLIVSNELLKGPMCQTKQTHIHLKNVSSALKQKNKIWNITDINQNID